MCSWLQTTAGRDASPVTRSASANSHDGPMGKFQNPSIKATSIVVASVRDYSRAKSSVSEDGLMQLESNRLSGSNGSGFCFEGQIAFEGGI